MKTLILMALMLCCSNVLAAYAKVGKPKAIYGSGWIRFGTQIKPSGTCNYYNRYFRFDATTEKGKNILSILLAAEMSGRDIEVWYSPSTSDSSSNHNNGCTSSSMALLTDIGLVD